jgi:hypothetical protein
MSVDPDYTATHTWNSVKAGAAHIAFTAPTRTAVRDFYAAALTAGARPNGAPASRCDEDGHFNAAVLDLDGNSIEVVFKNGADIRDDGTVIQHSRVITWQRSVHESYSDNRSVVSSRTRPAPSEVASKAESVASKAPTVARSVSEPIAVPHVTTTTDNGDGAAKTLIGTLLGAAAGAAVAYAMVRSERDSAKKESDFGAFYDAKNIVRTAAGYVAQASSQPKQPLQDPQHNNETAAPTPEPVHRNIDAQSYHSSTPPAPRSVYAPRQIEAAPATDTQSYYSSASQARSVSAPRQIEAAPSSYYSPSHITRAQPAEQLSLEYEAARSVAPSQARSRYTAARSVTSPELLTLEKARSTVSTLKPQSVAARSVARSVAPSVAHSAASGSLISSFVPDHEPRRPSEGSVHSSRSRAKSSHTSASRHSKHSRSHASEAPESSPSPPPVKAPSKAASVISSIFGKSSASKNDDFIDDLEIEELTEDDDMDTVVPSDSVSQAGGRRHRSSHSSKKHSDAASSVSKHSSASKHSHRSHRSSHKARAEDADDDTASVKSSESKSRRKHRPSVISEPSEASTVRPIKPSSSRKDSVTQGQYDGLFDEVKYGAGDVPVRGITPSMISAAGKNKSRTVVRHDMAAKARLFEGPA